MLNHSTPSMPDDPVTVPPADPREQAVSPYEEPLVRELKTLHAEGLLTFHQPGAVESIRRRAILKIQNAEMDRFGAVLDAYEQEKAAALVQLESMLNQFGYDRTLSLLDLKAAQMGLDE